MSKKDIEQIRREHEAQKASETLTLRLKWVLGIALVVGAIIFALIMFLSAFDYSSQDMTLIRFVGIFFLIGEIV